MRPKFDYQILTLVKRHSLHYPLLIKRDDISNTNEQLLNHLIIKVPDEATLVRVFEERLHQIE